MTKILRGNWILKVGVVFAVLSVPPAIPLVYEWLEWNLATRRYAVDQIYTLEARIGDHILALRDTAMGVSEQSGPITTLVDGRDFSVPWPARLRPEYSDVNRYYLRATLASWQDLKTGERRLVAVQGNAALSREHLRYRLLFVGPSGMLFEEYFSYADRAEPRYRVLLASYVSGASMNFRFAWAYGLPTVWFPLGYPLLSGIVGVGLLCAGLVIQLRKRLQTTGRLRSP